MKVEQVMSDKVKTCEADQMLNRAAQLMWEHDIGCVPIVSGGHAVGIITDRDICMAAYTQGRRLHEIPIRSVMSTELRSCAPSDTLESAAAVMKKHQLRRLLVLGPRANLVGLLSISDLDARARRRSRTRSRATTVPSAARVTTLSAVEQAARAAPSARVIHP